MSGKLEQAFHNVILLHALKDAPSELHRAVLTDKTSEGDVISHLNNYAQKLHADMKSSAEGNSSDGGVSGGKDGKKSSTAEKTLKFFRDSDADSRPTGAAELGSEDRTGSRQARLGKLFKS